MLSNEASVLESCFQIFQRGMGRFFSEFLENPKNNNNQCLTSLGTRVVLLHPFAVLVLVIWVRRLVKSK
jgi:hypothetical protein